MEWRILPWSSTSWALPMANPSPWNRVQVCFLDLFKQDHSSPHFNSPYAACSASAGGGLHLLVRHLPGLRGRPLPMHSAVFMELHLLPILCAYSFCYCQKEQTHLWNWKYPRNQFWGRAVLSHSVFLYQSALREKQTQPSIWVYRITFLEIFVFNVIFPMSIWPKAQVNLLIKTIA